MKWLIILLPFSLMSCSTFYYPNGNKLAVIGSNVKGLTITTKQIQVKADVIDNQVIHKEVGNTVVKTSGLLGPLIIPH